MAKKIKPRNHQNPRNHQAPPPPEASPPPEESDDDRVTAAPQGRLSPSTSRQRPKLIQIKRHIPGPPRRAPGQRIWLTAYQIKGEGLLGPREIKRRGMTDREPDFEYVKG